VLNETVHREVVTIIVDFVLGVADALDYEPLVAATGT
jgi:hypothetical protein